MDRNERRAGIIAALKTTETISSIGKRYDLTRQRIAQIMNEERIKRPRCHAQVHRAEADLVLPFARRPKRAMPPMDPRIKALAMRGR